MNRLERVKPCLAGALAILAFLAVACTAPQLPTTSPTEAQTAATDTPSPLVPSSPQASDPSAFPTSVLSRTASETPTALTVVKGRVQLTGAQNTAGATVTVRRIPEQVRAETVAQGLEVPWALAFAPDGRIFVTERPGRIRVIQNDRLLEQPLAVLEVASVSEAGLMGIAVDPDFGDNGYLYICYTYRTDSKELANRIARLTDSGGRAGNLRVILDQIPAARNHNGCRLRFGPDGKLYATMGDAQVPDEAQNLKSLSGKILRLEKDGSVPADNPFPGSLIYSYGHRNPQGLDWHPETGDLFITEHGPAQDDEVSIVAAGGNYGWPLVTGISSRAEFLDPILDFTPTIALAGAAFFAGESLASSWDGDFIFANLKGSHLRRIGLSPPEFRSVASQQILFLEEFGRLRAVALGPDGYIYFSTSNRDGRGRPFPGDDKILRLIPEGGEPTILVPTTGQGDFSLELEPGTYRLGIAASGYVPYQKRVTVGAREQIDVGSIQLEVSGGGSGGS